MLFKKCAKFKSTFKCFLKLPQKQCVTINVRVRLPQTDDDNEMNRTFFLQNKIVPQKFSLFRLPFQNFFSS